MQIVNLNPAETILENTYSKSDGTVVVLCDTSLAGFPVVLPDLTGSLNIKYKFYNLPLSSFGHNLTISTKNNQIIDVNKTSITLVPLKEVEIISEKTNRWLVGLVGYKEYLADSVTLSAGTSSNTVDDLKTAFDGNIYQINEAAATPGIELIVDFIEVGSFNLVRSLSRYQGSNTHAVTSQLYNWVTSSWDTRDSHTGIEIKIRCHDYRVYNFSNYVGTNANDGRVRVKLIHEMGGNASHDYYIDQIALFKE